MRTQPTGSVTFLFTDIVGSTALWEAHTEAMAAALARHDAILEKTASGHNGYIFKRLGDGFCIAFNSPADALVAAIEGQRVLSSDVGPGTGSIKVRMALHSGVADEREGDYFGPVVNRVARLMAVAHGGQILVSETTHQLLAGQAAAAVQWLDLGRHLLAGLAQPLHVYQVLAAGLPSGFPPIRSKGYCPNNLPAMTKPFVGRQREMAELEALLAPGKRRLITIVGPGGMGKTSLALELASRQCRVRVTDGQTPVLPFPDGVFFVPLAAVETAREIVPLINNSLNFQPLAEDPGHRLPRQQLLDYLSDKRLLVILDNFEQLTAEASIVADLLAAAPELLIVVTSRERLSLVDEQLFPLGGMGYPDAATTGELPDMVDRHSALALFVQSAQRVDPAFTLDGERLAEAVRICRLLDGLPLAIEMATGWVEMLSLAEIAAEIECDLGFLETDLQDVTARHRSMETVFDATWRRLEREERTLFQALAVFQGGFTREAAGEVASATLRQLAVLLKKSLLQFDQRHHRYQMHRLLRQYGASKLTADLPAEARVKQRHGYYYCRRLAEWGQDLFCPNHLEVVAEIDRDTSNVRAAWSWAVEQQALEQIDQAVDPLCQYYSWRIQQDQIEPMCRSAAERLYRIESPDSKRVLAKVLAWQGHSLPDEEDQLLLEKSLSLLDEAEAEGIDIRSEKAFALSRLAWLNVRSDYDTTLGYLNTALTLAESLGDTRKIESVLRVLTWHAIVWGKYEEAGHYNQRWLALLSQLGDRSGQAHAWNARGITATYQGNFETAYSDIRQSIALCREVEDRWRYASNLNHLGFLAMNLGRFAEARSAYEQQLVLLGEMKVSDAEPIAMAAFSLCHEGRYESAFTLLEEANSREGWHPGDRGSLAWAMGAALLGLGKPDEATPWLKESVATFEQIGQLTVLAGASAILAMAEPDREHTAQAVIRARQASSFLAYIMAVPAVAYYLLCRGELEQAIELFALASKHPFVAGSHWYRDLGGRPLKVAVGQLADEVVEAATARGEQRVLAATIADLADEFERIL